MTTLASALPCSFPSFSDSIRQGEQIEVSCTKPAASGYRALDQELPNGGWPPSVLIELLLSQPGIGELRMLAPTLARLTQAGRTIILLVPLHLPFAAALKELGIAPTNVVLIEADKPMDRIRAVEQALKSVDFGALLCWLPEARTDHMRRLQLAAADCNGLAFVFRPLSAQYQVSPAPLRMVCRPASAGAISVEIIKRRGPVHSAPIVLPLAIPESAAKTSAARTLVPAIFNMPPYTVNHAALAATAARHRAAIRI